MKICNYERVSLLGCFRDYKSLKGIVFAKGFNTSKVTDTMDVSRMWKSYNT